MGNCDRPIASNSLDVASLSSSASSRLVMVMVMVVAEVKLGDPRYS